jgi:hypothetical protein
MFRHIGGPCGMLGPLSFRSAAGVTSDRARATGHSPRKRCPLSENVASGLAPGVRGFRPKTPDTETPVKVVKRSMRFGGNPSWISWCSSVKS